MSKLKLAELAKKVARGALEPAAALKELQESLTEDEIPEPDGELKHVYDMSDDEIESEIVRLEASVKKGQDCEAVNRDLDHWYYLKKTLLWRKKGKKGMAPYPAPRYY